MTLTVKTPVTSGNNTTVASVTFTTVTDYVSGDLLIAIISANLSSSTATLNAPSGWTAIDAETGGTIRSMLVRKTAGASESNFTITPSAGNVVAANCTVFAVSGYDTTTPIAAHNLQLDASSTTSHVSPSITSTHNGSLIVMAAAADSSNNDPGTISGNSPFTLQGNRVDTDGGSRAWHGIQTEIQATAGAVTGTITTFNAQQAQTYIAAINPGITTVARTLTSTSGLKATLVRTLASTSGLTARLARSLTSTSALKGSAARTLASTSSLAVRHVRTLASTTIFKGQPARSVASTALLTGSAHRTLVSMTLLEYHEVTPLLASSGSGVTHASLLGPTEAILSGNGATKARFS